MRINCLACGHMVDVGDDYDDYEGEVMCFACGTILTIRTEQGKVKAVKLAKKDSLPTVEDVIDVPSLR